MRLTPLLISAQILALIYTTSCKKSNGFQDTTSPNTHVTDAFVPHVAASLSVDADSTYQTIDNFGASDAWVCQYVGNWSDSKRNAIADALFSLDTLANGQPVGVGLSLWRFNVGAGSGQQGDSSEIRDPWHRQESFLEPDGTYNWNRQAGQIWFMKAAKQRGVSKFLAFLNSPPVNYTVNGKAFSANGQANIPSANYPKLGDYIANVIKGVNSLTGVTFDYISPVNEPQLDWSNKVQEGCPFNNDQIARISRAINTSLVNAGLSTKIVIPEAYKINSLVTTANYGGRESQIDAFFKPGSTYLGNLSNLEKVAAAHAYYTTSPYATGATVRQQLKAKLKSVPNLRYWMSEYCVLGDNNGEINGNGKDLGITTALYVARAIHNDLANANASAWQWWLALSPYNYKDGLVYVSGREDGNYQLSQTLWALGNYSRFIRPGAVRIKASLENVSVKDNGLLVSSYKDDVQRTFTTVLVNSKDSIIDLGIKLKNVKVNSIRAYATSSNYSLKPISNTQLNFVSIPAKSIVTLVGKME